MQKQIQRDFNITPVHQIFMEAASNIYKWGFFVLCERWKPNREQEPIWTSIIFMTPVCLHILDL